AGTGVEGTIIGLARDKGIPIKGLETAEFQYALSASLAEAKAVDRLKADFAGAEDKEGRAVVDRLITSWRNGDIENLGAILDQLDKDEDPVVRKREVTDRNFLWVAKIRTIMANPGTYFVVVGAAHLVGPDSVIAMLQDAGVKVER